MISQHRVILCSAFLGVFLAMSPGCGTKITVEEGGQKREVEINGQTIRISVNGETIELKEE